MSAAICLLSLPSLSATLSQLTRYKKKQKTGYVVAVIYRGGSVAEWLACWTQTLWGARVQIAAATLSGNSLRQTVHTHRASVYQAAKLVMAYGLGR